MYIAIISSNSYAVFNLCGHCPLPLELYVSQHQHHVLKNGQVTIVLVVCLEIMYPK